MASIKQYAEMFLDGKEFEFNTDTPDHCVSYGSDRLYWMYKDSIVATREIDTGLIRYSAVRFSPDNRDLTYRQDILFNAQYRRGVLNGKHV